jgi:Mrp family chromosome partitioning ATPase
MFDALRRAESERRRKYETDDAARAAPTDAREQPVERRGAEAPAHPRADAATPAAPSGYRPSTNGSDPFPGELLRELGILRNSIEARLEPSATRVLVFTSAMRGEGVSTLAVAYARLLALHGDARVLLVELNARNPSFASRFGLSRSEGLTHYFESGHRLDALAQRPARESFDVLHVGRSDPALLQINLERLMPRLFEEARRSYDAVIVDAPPIVTCPETPPLAPLVDGVVLVVHCRRTKRETVKRSVAQVEQFKGRVVGVVLNRKRYYIPEFIYRRL